MNRNNIIKESIEELKGIPQGKDFSKRPSSWKADGDWDGYIYKVVRAGEITDSYANLYHRKLSDGWKYSTNDCYGIVGYTHLFIRGALRLVPSYGTTIIKIKLLGGFDRYVFFDADIDPDIKKALIGTYGKPLSVREQLFLLTGNQSIADKYAYISSSDFGKRGAEAVMRESGKIIRGFVCEYTRGDAMASPLVFSDMITCAKAEGLSGYESEDDVKAKFVGTLDAKRRSIQDNYVDLVPHLYAVNAVDPDGGEGARIEDKIYVHYTSRSGEHNMLVIDEHNWGNPQDTKLFPSGVKLDQGISNPSRKGTILFSMHGQPYIGNVCGLMSDGQKADVPVFAIKGFEDVGWWPMDADTLTGFYTHPEWAKEIKMQRYSGEGEQQQDPNDVEQQNNTNAEYSNVIEESDLHLKLLNEAFKPGMSYDDFVANNKGIGYVCAHCYGIEGLMQQGFSREYAAKNDANYNDGRGWYGNGVYGCVQVGRIAPPNEFNDNLSMKEAGAARLSFYRDSADYKPDDLKYGGVILKCSIIGGYHRFLILDREMAEKYYGKNWTIEGQIETLIGKGNPDAIALIRKMNSKGNVRYDVTNSDSRTGGSLLDVFKYVSVDEFKKWENVFRKYNIRGAVYHGGNDGFCFVCYDYSEVVPIALSYDHGRTWTTKGNSWTLKNGKTYTTNGIDWQAVHDRLISAGDPQNKLGAIYDEVDIGTQQVRFFGNERAGLAMVRCKNGKYNFVTMQEIHGNDGNVLYNQYDKIFPVDFDDKASISLKGTITFTYKGVDFRGKVYDEEANGPVLLIPKRTVNGVVEEKFEMQYLDWFAENYNAYVNGAFDENGEEYEQQDDAVSNQQIQEEFFRFLDKIELI